MGATASDIFSGVGHYKVETIDKRTTGGYNTTTAIKQTDGTYLSASPTFTIKRDAGTSTKRAILGWNNETGASSDLAVTSIVKNIDIMVPTGELINKPVISSDFGDGYAEYVDITDLVSQYGDGDYSVVNLPMDVTKHSIAALKGWTSWNMILVNENVTYPTSMVVINDFAAFDGNGVTGGMITSNNISAPDGYTIPRGSKVVVATNVSTMDNGDSLTISASDGQDNYNILSLRNNQGTHDFFCYCKYRK